MKKPSICASIVNSDLSGLSKVEPLVDRFEVRIDLTGNNWQDVVKHLKKPWIACNRRVEEGGKGETEESQRINKLLKAIELGAGIVDIELGTKNLTDFIPAIKEKARCLVSSHLGNTPPLAELKKIVKEQLESGADICKVVTTARKFEDNLTVLSLFSEFPEARLISFAMGNSGLISRVICPLAGGYFTYAAIDKGKESAPGQLTVAELDKIYKMIQR